MCNTWAIQLAVREHYNYRKFSFVSSLYHFQTTLRVLDFGWHCVLRETKFLTTSCPRGEILSGVAFLRGSTFDGVVSHGGSFRWSYVLQKQVEFLMASYLIKVTFHDARTRFSVTICFTKNSFLYKEQSFRQHRTLQGAKFSAIFIRKVIFKEIRKVTRAILKIRYTRSVNITLRRLSFYSTLRLNIFVSLLNISEISIVLILHNHTDFFLFAKPHESITYF